MGGVGALAPRPARKAGDRRGRQGVAGLRSHAVSRPDSSKPDVVRNGPGRLVRALRYSLRGVAHALRHERAFRQECVLALVLVPVALWLPADASTRALLVASVLLVLVVELLNSAIEAALDRHSREFHVLTGRAKDYASAAVFLSLVNCVAVWALVLWDLHERGRF